MMRLPTFIIGGERRCGTTSIDFKKGLNAAERGPERDLQIYSH